MSSFSPLTLLQERQCAPIYNLLDSGNPSSALKQCESVLSTQPDLQLAKSLKALALVRLGRRDAASQVADELLASKAGLVNASVLMPLTMVLQDLHRGSQEVDLLEAASKVNGASEDLIAKAFMAMVRDSQWQRAQQTALRLHKIASARGEDLYFWWSMQAYALVALDNTLPGHQLALPLATRMIEKQVEAKPFGGKSDEEMYLYASILARQGRGKGGKAEMIQRALDLLQSDTGQKLCDTSMALALLKRELQLEVKDWRLTYKESMSALEKGERNWSQIKDVIEAVSNLRDEAAFVNVEEGMVKLISGRKGKMDRGLRLGRLELAKAAGAVNSSTSGSPLTRQQSSIKDLFLDYLTDFSDKACTCEDLVPYAECVSQAGHLEAVRSTLGKQIEASTGKEIGSLNDLYRQLNTCKLHRLTQPENAITSDSERALALRYLDFYLLALPVGKELPKTEMQPADDFALMASQAFVSASSLTEDVKVRQRDIYLAIVVLEAALDHSPMGYRLRVLLIMLFTQQGAVGMAKSHFETLGPRAVQHETLGWLFAHRAAAKKSMIDTESERDFDATMGSIARIWKESQTQVPQMVCKAFEHGTFSRVEELADFGKRLENSIARHLHTLERLRIQASKSAGKPIGGADTLKADIRKISSSLSNSEVKPFDQRDFNVLLNLLPACRPSIGTLVANSRTKKEPGLEYLSAMLSVASVHLGAEDKVDIEENSEELSDSELLLHRLAVSISSGSVEWATGELFDGCKKIIENCILPHSVLHTSSIALEGFSLLLNVRARYGENQSPVDGAVMEKARSLLSKICEELEKRISGHVLDLDESIAHALDRLQGGEGKGIDAFKTCSVKMQDATQKAVIALMERIRNVLDIAVR